MSNFVEFDIDFDACGEVEKVIVHDECGEHEDVEFYRDGLLAEENAKLREFASELVKGYECGYGSLCKECGIHISPVDYVCLVYERARELGIEVDG